MWFSDEGPIMPKKCGKLFIRKKSNEKWNNPEFITNKRKMDNSIMIWIMISPDGVKEIRWTNKNRKYMDSGYYIKILKE